MKKVVNISVLVFVLCFCALSGFASPFSKIYKEAHESVFLISNEEVQDSNKVLNYGTAFAIDSRGTLVTAAHLCKEGALVKDSIGRVYPILDTLWVDETLDLAVIKVAGKFKPLELGEVNDVEVGDEVIVISNPSGFQNTISTGVLSAKRQDDKKIHLQHTSPISLGSSGAPLFNDQGQVVGVIQGAYDSENSQNINFALPVEYLPAKFLSQNHDLIAYRSSVEGVEIEKPAEIEISENNFVEAKVSVKENTKFARPSEYVNLINELNLLIGQRRDSFELYLLRAIFKNKNNDLSGAKNDIERAQKMIEKQVLSKSLSLGI